MRKTSRGYTEGQHGADRTLIVGGVYGALTLGLPSQAVPGKMSSPGQYGKLPFYFRNFDMQELDSTQYDAWRRTADVLEQDRYGEKVMRLADGTFLKLFRRKSWLSKTAFYPPAKRFADNAAELRRLGIPCPRVLQLYRLNNPFRSVVHYEPLPGKTLRQLLTQEPSLDQLELFALLAEFIT